MEIISEIPLLGGFLSTSIAFVVVLGVVVFVHEYGHYIVARWTGIHSETFSIGFGPVIWSKTDSRGTQWQIAAIPLGGYVKFLGDRNAASGTTDDSINQMSTEDRDRSFPLASVGARALTVAAGPISNFLLATMIFASLMMWQGVATNTPTVGEIIDLPDDTFDLQIGDQILTIEGQEVSTFGDIIQVTLGMDEPREMELLVLRQDDEILLQSPYLLVPAVYSVDPMSAASDAGIKSGDVFLEADGIEVDAFSELQEIVLNSKNKEIPLKIWRVGEILELSITPTLQPFPDGNGGITERVMIGVYGAFAFMPATETPMPWTALYKGAKQTGYVISSSLNGIKHMFLGNLSPTNLQGPVGIAQVSKETANQGVITFLSFIAVISTGIGMLNLFPIPMLDGGHLVFYAVEAVRGRPADQKTIQAFMSIGLAMVLLLMVFVTYNDLMRL